MPNLNLSQAHVLHIDGENEVIQHLTVKIGEESRKAVNFLALNSRLCPGQEVLVNTTAVDLKLGSGGADFVIPTSASLEQGWGHQMKMRYTPVQIRVNSVEEQDSPWHQHFLEPGGLEGIPVISAELHSMLAPLALSIKALDPAAKIVNLYTDGGALPAHLSRNLHTLKETGALTQVITAGHSFGGDLESINVFSGLQAAGRVAKADYVIASMGPGIAGTGTVFGFSGLEQCTVLQAAQVLGGYPILAPRIGFADSRERHQGLSHHSLTILNLAYSGPSWVALPLIPQPKRSLLANQVKKLSTKCRIKWRDGEFIREIAAKNHRMFVSMGRSFAENSEFFLALAASARIAVELRRSKPFPGSIAIK